MNALVQSASDWVGQMGVVVLAIFLRVGAAMAMLPAFGEQVVPVRVRLAAALAFTALLAPLMSIETSARIVEFWSVNFGGAEVLNGLILGFAFRLFVMALTIAGMMAASATSLAQIFGGGVGVDPQPAIGNVMVVSGLALATLGGLHVKMLEALLLSYTALPAGIWPNVSDVASWAMADISRAFALGFVIAAPFTVAAFLYNLALGVINRAMPQLMVAFVGAPALTLGGLILLVLSLPFALQHWMGLFDATLASPLGSSR
ncbi:MAG: flagellar biosynthetic protein FliR [Dinoroseobacter sp.]|nr:flagellar biosynthetic protein FliR [Dinoroseobacter sp.]